MWTEWHNDLGGHPTFDSGFDAALSAIEVRTVVIQAETGQYFPPVDSEYEVSRLPNADLRTIPTTWGHIAPFNLTDQPVIDSALNELLMG